MAIIRNLTLPIARIVRRRVYRVRNAVLNDRFQNKSIFNMSNSDRGIWKPGAQLSKKGPSFWKDAVALCECMCPMVGAPLWGPETPALKCICIALTRRSKRRSLVLENRAPAEVFQHTFPYTKYRWSRQEHGVRKPELSRYTLFMTDNLALSQAASRCGVEADCAEL